MLGKLFRRRLINAIAELAEQEESFTQFTVSQASDAGTWKQEVEDYENNPQNPNPYELPKSGELTPFFRSDILTKI